MNKRIVPVDIFRGLTIALMIIVNNPGTWAHIYRPLDHAEWFGVTPTDWVFPFFLFIVGTSIVLAYHNRPTDNWKTYKRIISRTVKLILLGWFLAAYTLKFPYLKTWDRLRIPGVLFRIGVVFFFAALIYLFFKWLWKKTGMLTALTFLLVLIAADLGFYWYAMIGKYELQGTAPVEQLIAEKLNKTDNLASQIDRKVLGVNHMWRHWDPEAGKRVQGDYDPEGLFSTLPAIATALLGMLLGLLLLYVPGDGRRIIYALILGGILIGLGFLWKPWFPFGKKLWTSSYVLYMAGLAFVIYAVVHFVYNFISWRGWAFPFIALGMNAIAVFFLNGFIAKTFYMLKIHGKAVHYWLYHYTWGHWLGNNESASLMYALSVLTFYILLAIYLYRRKIFFKV